MSYNVVFLYIKDFWLNFIFETLDDQKKKNNQKIGKANMGSQLEQDKYIIEISYFKINAFRLKSINLRNQYCFLKWVKRKKRKGYG